MGLLSWGKSVKEFFEDTADAAATYVEDWMSEARDAYEEATEALEDIPIIGKVLATVTRWLGRVVEAFAQALAAVVRAFGYALGSLVYGLTLILTGAFVAGLIEIFHGLVGAILVIVGSIISFLQTVLGAERRRRKLNDAERKLLHQVFCVSVDLDKIRLIIGAAGVFDNTERPFTLGNVIYMKRTEQWEWSSALVHETSHVWQYQAFGPRYSSEALSAQFWHDYQFENAYSWWDPAINEGEFVWASWNRESQANFVEDVWERGQLSRDGGKSFASSPAGIYFLADDQMRIGRFVFAPRALQDADPRATQIRLDAIARWKATVPAGKQAVDYTPTADEVRHTLHTGVCAACTRVPCGYRDEAQVSPAPTP